MAVAAGSFKTLAAALGAAGLVDTLKGPGPFAVFAPTDEAFAKLPAGTVETLLKPENKEKLVNILAYHVVAGKVPAAAATKLTALNKKDIVNPLFLLLDSPLQSISRPRRRSKFIAFRQFICLFCKNSKRRVGS